VDGIFVLFPCHVNTQREIAREIARKCKVNDCQFPIPLEIVYICMVLLGIVGIPISRSLDTPLKVSQNWLNYFQWKGFFSLDMLDDVNEMEKYTQLNDQSILAIKWYVVLLFYQLINTDVFIFYFVHDVQCVPTSMIPDALFREFLAKTVRKLSVSGRNPPEVSGIRHENPVIVSGCQF